MAQQQEETTLVSLDNNNSHETLWGEAPAPSKAVAPAPLLLDLDFGTPTTSSVGSSSGLSGGLSGAMSAGSGRAWGAGGGGGRSLLEEDGADSRMGWTPPAPLQVPVGHEGGEGTSGGSGSGSGSGGIQGAATLFSGLQAKTVGTSGVQAQAAAPPLGVPLAKDTGVLQASKMVLTLKHNGNLDFSSLSFPPHLNQEIGSSLKRTPRVNTMLCEDGCLHLSYYISYKENETVVAFFVSNLTAANLSNVRITIDRPSNLNVRYVSVEGAEVRQAGDEAGSGGAKGGQGSVWVERLSGQSVLPVAAAFSFREHSFNMSVRAIVDYTNSHLQTAHLQAALPLPIAHLLRPMEMSTGEYGKRWGVTTQEQKVRKSGCAAFHSIAHLVAFIQEQLNAHHIQTIRVEAISCGRLIGSNELCLIHGKVPSASNVEITIRTTNKFFTEAIARYVDRILQ
jgi:hypothetical protein